MKNLDYLVNKDAPSAGFSLGKFKDNTGANDGSAGVVQTINDLYYGFVAMITNYLGVVSDTDETESASDVLDSVVRIGSVHGAASHIESFNYPLGTYIRRDGINWISNANINTGVDGIDFWTQYGNGKWDSTIIQSGRKTIYGFSMINNVTLPLVDVDLGAGETFDKTTGDIITVGAMVKKLNANWVAGTAAGMLDIGAIAADSTYFIWAIKKDTDSSGDYLASLSSTAPTMPTDYTMKRLIRVCRTDPGGATIMPGIWIVEDNKLIFEFETVQIPINGVAIATVQTNYNLFSWAGVQCYSQIDENPGRDNTTISNSLAIALGSTDQILVVSGSGTNTTNSTFRGTSGSRNEGGTVEFYNYHNMREIRVDSSEQIAGIKNDAPYQSASVQTTVQQFSISTIL